MSQITHLCGVKLLALRCQDADFPPAEIDGIQ